MPTYRSFEFAHDEELPAGHTSEFRTPDALVEHFLTEHTEEGDRVIDVFAGYGTTLTVAERLGRIPFGVEYESDRVSYVERRIETPEHVRRGDVLELDPSWFPACDCCFTSLPFMERTDHRNPFRNYAGESTYTGTTSTTSKPRSPGSTPCWLPAQPSWSTWRTSNTRNA